MQSIIRKLMHIYIAHLSTRLLQLTYCVHRYHSFEFALDLLKDANVSLWCSKRKERCR